MMSFISRWIWKTNCGAKAHARCFLALEALENRTAPANLVVNTLDDTPAVNPNVSALDANGNTSLRSAIQFLNVVGPFSPTNLIDFRPPAGNAGDDGGGTPPPLTGTISLGSALPAVAAGNVTINGSGMTSLFIARSTAVGTPAFGIFSIAQGTTCTINSLSVVNGIALDGGGIQNNGWLTLNSVDADHNAATEAGGGVWNAAGATLVATSCQIWENSAPFGGGIDNEGTAYVNSGTQISLNVATVGGGGIYNASTANLGVGSTQIYSNTAIRGGGVYNYGVVTIAGGSLSGNTATGMNGLGGGIYNRSSAVPQLTNVTVSGNSAFDGGGFYLTANTSIALQGCTFTGNTASDAGNAGYCANADSLYIDDGGNTFAPGQIVWRPPQ
jgi:hypothetical protein